MRAAVIFTVTSGNDPVNGVDPSGLKPSEPYWVQSLQVGQGYLDFALGSAVSGIRYNTSTPNGLFNLGYDFLSSYYQEGWRGPVRGLFVPALEASNAWETGDARSFGRAFSFSLSIAGGAVCGRVGPPSRTIRVTSWAETGVTPDLAPGRWVIKGEPTKFNFWRTGLPGPKMEPIPNFPWLKIESSKVPFENHISANVPRSYVGSPKGIDGLKGRLFGQHQLK